MTSHREVAIAFVERRKLSGSRMFTDGKTVWSYGYHFPIAHHIKDNTVLYNQDGYSANTSSHKTHVRRALTDKFIVITCTTREITSAIYNPENPIIIYKNKELKHAYEIIELFYNNLKREGLKHFKNTKDWNNLKKSVEKLYGRLTIQKI